MIPKDRHGHVPGIAIGDVFEGKIELLITGVHKKFMGGIRSLGADDAAYSIILNGGYEDEDEGEEIWYTGEQQVPGGSHVRSN